MTKTLSAIFIASVIFLENCNPECHKCIPKHSNPTLYIHYRSSTSDDLFDSQTGIYDPKEVVIYEVAKDFGRLVQTEVGTPGKNVETVSTYSRLDHQVKYNCSISSQRDLQMTLIQLKVGVVDTLTYESSPGFYPTRILYNGTAVWWHESPRSIFIVK